MSPEPRGLAIFDMDGVLTGHVSSWKAVCDYLGVDNRKNLEAYRSGGITYEEFMKRDIALWKEAKADISRSDIEGIMQKIPIIQHIPETVSYLHDSGIVTAIVSGGLSDLSRIVSMKAGFDHVYSNPLHYDQQGLLINRAEPVVIPNRKNIIVSTIQEREGIPVERTVGVGDSIIDLSMFRKCGKSIAFNLTDERIRQYSDMVIVSDSLMDVGFAINALIREVTS
ncbi:MAG: HAD-IB family phosphatase [Candidatus Thermoplasmatota archaeon]|nr:HAD-IB family phosphatase [Candidatus Thermoplasmatota archaeon]MCL5730759.1 HAD-IB family phosphatase [Candidatus Thermoplasmatota archaeon]